MSAAMPAGLPPDLADQAREFVGRDWALERVCKWLSVGRGRVLMVTAQPGAGKTAVASRLVQISRGEVSGSVGARRPVIHAAHFCRWGFIESIAPIQVLESLSSQLASSLTGYAEVLALAGSGGAVQINLGQQSVRHVGAGASVTMTQIGHVTIARQDPRQAFDLVLRQPLRALQNRGQLPYEVVVLIDGLDESVEGTPETTLVSLLSAELSNQVPGLRLVITARPKRVVPRLAEYVNEQFDLIADQPPRIGDLELYAKYKLRRIPRSARLPLSRRIARASDGNFLYAHHLIEDLLASKSPASDLRDLELPASLSAVYRRFLDREIGAESDAWSLRFRPVLGALVQARGGGLTRDQLIAITGLPPSTVDDTLSICGPYLAGGPTSGLRPYHLSLRDYLRRPGRHHIYPAEASWRIVTGLMPVRGGAMRWDLADEYLLRHGPEFAVDANQVDQVLTDPEFLVHADPLALMPLLGKARDDAAVLAASIYGSSADWHRYLDPGARRRALAIDAASYGASHLAARLARPLPWEPLWTLGTVIEEFGQGKGFCLGYNPGPRARQIIALGNQQVLLTHDPNARAALQMWDLASGRPVGGPFADRVTAVGTAQLHRAAVAVSGSYEGTLTVWSLARRQPLGQPLTARGAVTAVSCINTGRLALAVSAHKIFNEEVVLDPGPGQLKEPLSSDVRYEGCVPRGPENGLGNGNWNEFSSITWPRRVIRVVEEWELRVWNLAAGQQHCRPIPIADGPVLSLACSQVEGRAVAVTGSNDGKLRIWDLATGREHGRPIPIADGAVLSLACSQVEGRAVAVTGSDDGKLQVCDLTARQQMGASLDSGPMTWAGRSPIEVGPVSHVACASLNGHPVAVSGSYDGMVRVWDLTSCVILDTIPLWRTSIVGLAVAPTGYLAAGTALGVTAMRWKLKTGNRP